MFPLMQVLRQTVNYNISISDLTLYICFFVYQDDLPQIKEIENSLAIFVMATYGEGDPTDNAQEFHEWLQSDRDDLEGLNFSVSKIKLSILSGLVKMSTSVCWELTWDGLASHPGEVRDSHLLNNTETRNKYQLHEPLSS